MMRVLFFLYFPVSDELGVDELPYLNNIPSILGKVRKYCRDNNIEPCFVYDDNNIYSFLGVVGAFSEVLPANTVEDLKNVAHKFLGRNSINIANATRLKKGNFSIRFEKSSLENDLNPPLVLQNIPGNESHRCLISFIPGHPTSYGYVYIISGDRAKPDIPQIDRVPLYSSIEDIVEWIVSRKQNTTSISESPDFELTRYRWGNQHIYFHHKDKTYWYYDFFHRDNRDGSHYEVFDHTGENWLGEADTILSNPQLPPKAKPSEKKISHILHGK